MTCVSKKDNLGFARSPILGEDEHFDWDRAYIVRKEATEARQYV